MKLIYVAGKQSAPTFSQIDDNIKKAENASIVLWSKGWAVFTPHLNTSHFERYELVAGIGYGTWIKGSIEILSRCDAIFMLKDYAESKGALGELEYALTKNMEVFYEYKGYPDAG